MKKNIYDLLSNAKLRLLALALIGFSGSAYAQATYTFSYTGTTQSLVLLAGTYSTQCWGGDGYTQTSGFNGRGGYAVGILTLSTTQTIYINVGGLGSYPSSGVSANVWTFNGGGVGYPASNSAYGNGGGASDVRTVGGLWDNSTSLASRVIVAGGGGAGRNSSYIGGNGGGLTGGTGTYFSPDQTGGPTGGTQTSGGSNTGYTSGLTLATLGKAATWDGTTLTASFLAGGGGGYYGGASGRVAGGGGSSYVGGVSSGTTIMFGQTGFVANPDVSGNGLVIIKELCNITLYAAGNTNSLNPMICSGQTATLMTNAISNYSWSTGATSSSLVVSPTTNTVYALTATSPSNCTSSKSISITVSSGVPVLSISNPSNNICLGKTISLTASGAITYTWANPGVVNGQTFTPVSTAIYSVSGQNGCGITTATTTVTVAPLQVTTLASPTLVCQGSPSTLTAVSAVPNYTWLPSGTGGATTIVAPTANSIYTVTASDGTCAGTQTVAVNVKTTPTLNVSTTATAICEGQQVVLSATGANTYTWMPGNLSGSSVTVSPSTSTVYIVTGENTVNCSASGQQVLIVNASPTINIVASKLLVCPGQSVILNANGGNSYVWTGGPSTLGYTVTPNITTVYTVTGSHNTNTCTTAKEVTISVLVPNVTPPTNTAVCIGGSATLTASGANKYVWNSVSTGSIGIYIMQPQTTTTVTLVATTQSLTTTCPTTHSVVVTVNPLPTLTVTPAKATVCKGQTNTLTVSGAQTYSWTSTITGNTILITPTATILYTVAGTDANGCMNTGSHQAKISSCIGIDEFAPGISQLSIYPNPNNGTFFIRSESATVLMLANQLGEELRRIELTNSNGFSVEIKGLSSGVYFIRSEGQAAGPLHKIVVN